MDGKTEKPQILIDIEQLERDIFENKASHTSSPKSFIWFHNVTTYMDTITSKVGERAPVGSLEKAISTL